MLSFFDSVSTHFFSILRKRKKSFKNVGSQKLQDMGMNERT